MNLRFVLLEVLREFGENVCPLRLVVLFFRHSLEFIEPKYSTAMAYNNPLSLVKRLELLLHKLPGIGQFMYILKLAPLVPGQHT